MTASAFPDVRQAIQALQNEPASRWSGRIASVLHDIEQAFEHGASRAQVHATLTACGIGITFEGFKKALYRLRKRQRDAAQLHQDGATAPVRRNAEAHHAAPAKPPHQLGSGPQQSAQATTPPTTTVAAALPMPPASSAPAPVPRPVAPSLSTSTWTPGSIGEIARSRPDMVGLAKKGREYGARLAAEKKHKEDEAKAKGIPPA